MSRLLPRHSRIEHERDGLAALASEALRATQAERQLALTLGASVQALASLLDLRDGYTSPHSGTVVALCEQVARRVGVTGEELGHLRIAAHLHDLGKIGVPDEILHKPGPLNDTEWAIMREHPVWGARALESIPGFAAASRAVRHHHERWDGGGYPDGLAGEDDPDRRPHHRGLRRLRGDDLDPPLPPRARPSRSPRERIIAGDRHAVRPGGGLGLLGALADSSGQRTRPFSPS